MNTNDDIQQGKLTGMLIKLSTETDPNIEEYIEQLKNIYVPGFRHSYSNITAVVFKIYNENSQALTTLGENLFTIENLISKVSRNIGFCRSLIMYRAAWICSSRRCEP